MPGGHLSIGAILYASPSRPAHHRPLSIGTAPCGSPLDGQDPRNTVVKFRSGDTGTTSATPRSSFQQVRRASRTHIPTA